MPVKPTDTPPCKPSRKARARRRDCRVLLVQPAATHRTALEQCGNAQRPMCVIHAPTLHEARRYLARQAVDLAVIDPAMPDGDGHELAAELHRHSRTTATVLLATTADFAAAQKALRVGADDLLLQQTPGDELSQRVQAVLDRKGRDKAREQRVQRLRRLCRRLNEARVETTRQVDILCNDLVVAYQELACQMQHVTQTTQYTSQIDNELDLETVLRKTLEHLMQKLGPSNAAIFLPATLDEYSLGGYVNFDCPASEHQPLLDQLADRLAPKVAVTEDLVHLTTPEDIAKWLDDDEPSLLSDTQILSVACMHEDECLAVITLFRKASTGYTEEHLDRVSSIGPALGATLDRIIRIHHRSIFGQEPL